MTDYQRIRESFDAAGVACRLLGAPDELEVYEAPECQHGRMQIYIDGGDAAFVFGEDEQFIGTLINDVYHGASWRARV